MGTRRKSRECALQAMFQVDITHDRRYLLERYWKENPCSEVVKEFTTQLVTGCLEHLSEIDKILEKHTENWSLSRMGRVDRNVLRLAVYELFYREDIPAKVTLNEAIAIVKKYAEETSGAFINGILDRILKTEPKIQKKLESLDTASVNGESL
ncbi:MAG: transcription antitermination factor NusB [Nitrospirae bacterium]|nr:transcription antitermination factor NusB [Nitrospirota bacterium]MBI3351225.1 transcription antitermination factor NusB [Nitrospirota bacterium]